MDDGYSVSPPCESINATAGYGGSASKFLRNLPSRGLFSSTSISSNPGRMRFYICYHDTTPPEDQIIRTNEENMLITILTLKNQNGDTCSKDWKGSSANQRSRKRPANKASNVKAAGKKAMLSIQPAFSQGLCTRAAYMWFTESLRALLRDKGSFDCPFGRQKWLEWEL